MLPENGVEDMVILEASNRVGSRIRKEHFGGVSVELGADWIASVDGPQRNPVKMNALIVLISEVEGFA
ncbi:hypothetical protein Fmac_021212 [Flemingia macrophylla]|uniref:Amine oxidase domain-containing protein n=1 Tax=Flemingia macrophylla TaxID=520843 RepID=A0ABD1LXX6_9FABA